MQRTQDVSVQVDTMAMVAHHVRHVLLIQHPLQEQIHYTVHVNLDIQVMVQHYVTKHLVSYNPASYISGLGFLILLIKDIIKN